VFLQGPPTATCAAPAFPRERLALKRPPCAFSPQHCCEPGRRLQGVCEPGRLLQGLCEPCARVRYAWWALGRMRKQECVCVCVCVCACVCVCVCACVDLLAPHAVAQATSQPLQQQSPDTARAAAPLCSSVWADAHVSLPVCPALRFCPGTCMHMRSPQRLVALTQHLLSCSGSSVRGWTNGAACCDDSLLSVFWRR
jgi:hypothetical protein